MEGIARPRRASGIPRVLGREPLGRRRLISAAWQLGTISLVLTGALVLVAALLHKRYAFMFDFQGDLYIAGKGILHGSNPYQLPFLEHLVALKRAGGNPSGTFAVPVYPPPVLLLFVPFSLLPLWLDGGLFILASGWAVVAGLRMLGVRDWRCVLVAVASFPSVFGIYLGTLSPWLVLAAGITWRYREQVWRPSAAIASAVVAKLFPWPIGVWLLVTKRFRTLAVAVALALFITLIAWAAIGFDGMTSYPRMLADLSYVEDAHGISLLSVLTGHGVASNVATAVVIAVTAGLLVAAWRIARGQDGDRRSFGLVVLAALAGSPLVWPHYVVLVFVPVALISSTWSPIWAVPLLLYLSSPTPNPQSWREMVPWLAVQAILATRLLVGPIRVRNRFTSRAGPIVDLGDAAPAFTGTDG